MKKEIDLNSLISEGESSSLEFKASAIFSFDSKQNDKNLFYPIIKSICALANSEGGKILVGYHERFNEFVGIEKDGKKDNDGNGHNMCSMMNHSSDDGARLLWLEFRGPGGEAQRHLRGPQRPPLPSGGRPPGAAAGSPTGVRV